MEFEQLIETLKENEEAVEAIKKLQQDYTSKNMEATTLKAANDKFKAEKKQFLESMKSTTETLKELGINESTDISAFKEKIAKLEKLKENDDETQGKKEEKEKKQKVFDINNIPEYKKLTQQLEELQGKYQKAETEKNKALISSGFENAFPKDKYKTNTLIKKSFQNEVFVGEDGKKYWKNHEDPDLPLSWEDGVNRLKENSDIKALEKPDVIGGAGSGGSNGKNEKNNVERLRNIVLNSASPFA